MKKNINLLFVLIFLFPLLLSSCSLKSDSEKATALKEELRSSGKEFESLRSSLDQLAASLTKAALENNIVEVKNISSQEIETIEKMHKVGTTISSLMNKVIKLDRLSFSDDLKEFYSEIEKSNESRKEAEAKFLEWKNEQITYLKNINNSPVDYCQTVQEESKKKKIADFRIQEMNKCFKFSIVRIEKYNKPILQLRRTNWNSPLKNFLNEHCCHGYTQLYVVVKDSRGMNYGENLITTPENENEMAETEVWRVGELDGRNDVKWPLTLEIRCK